MGHKLSLKDGKLHEEVCVCVCVCVVFPFNPRTQEAEVGEFEVCLVYIEFQDSQGYIDLVSL